MRKNKKPAGIIPKGSLNELLEKFSQENVIAVIEKEYQSAPSRLIWMSLIDDSEVVSEVVYPPETIDDFAQRLKEKGIYNPLVVRPKEDGRYELILGRKRYLGAKQAGILSLPCAISHVEDEEMLLMLLADARDQKHGNVVEMALVCQALSERFGYTQKTLADLSHQSRCQITNIVRILKLPLELRQQIEVGNLSYGAAKAIASLPSDQMKEVAELAMARDFSVREVENYVKSLSLSSFGATAIEEELSRKYRGKVTLKKKAVTITFDDEERKNAFVESLLEG